MLKACHYLAKLYANIIVHSVLAICSLHCWVGGCGSGEIEKSSK